jgi:YhcH/YjgK/YiaL family protein
MIITNVNSKDLKSLESVHPRFASAFEFIKKAVKEDLADGNYEIDGKDIFAFISSYKTETESEAKFEAHKKFKEIEKLAEVDSVKHILQSGSGYLEQTKSL